MLTSKSPARQRAAETLITDGTDFGEQVRNIVNVNGSATNVGPRTSFDVFTYDGNDTIGVQPNVTVPVNITAGLGNDSMNGGAGNDYIEGSGGTDVILGSSGNDTTVGGSGDDSTDFSNFLSTSAFVDVDLSTGSGDRVSLDGVVVYTNWLIDTENVAGTMGNDTIAGNSSSNELFGLEGNDYIVGRGGDDILYGGDAVDTLFGESGADTMYGGDSNDILVGGSGIDSMRGDNGNDYFDARDGSGGDSMFGGSGTDSRNDDSGDFFFQSQ